MVSPRGTRQRPSLSDLVSVLAMKRQATRRVAGGNHRGRGGAEGENVELEHARPHGEDLPDLRLERRTVLEARTGRRRLSSRGAGRPLAVGDIEERVMICVSLVTAVAMMVRRPRADPASPRGDRDNPEVAGTSAGGPISWTMARLSKTNLARTPSAITPHLIRPQTQARNPRTGCSKAAVQFMVSAGSRDPPARSESPAARGGHR